MNFDYLYALEIIVDVAMNLYTSPFMSFVKFFLIIYTLVLILDLILLLILRGIGGDIRTGLRGIDMPIISKSKMQKNWKKIRQRVDSKNVSQFKVAILEADAIVDDILKKIGYAGNDMAERLEQIKPGQFDYLEELKNIHQIRNRIVHEEDFVVDKKLTEETLDMYEKVLRYLEFI